MRPRGRRFLAATLPLLSASLVALASCLTFNDLPLPSPADAADASPPLDAAPPYPGYLTVPQAAQVCSLVFQCKGLDQAIASSIALPLVSVDRVTPYNYSLCVNALSGSLDPSRAGLPVQRAMLTALAAATTCSEALAIPWTHISDLPAGCQAGCIGNAVAFCKDGLLTELECASPTFGDAGTCYETEAGPTCVHLAPCTTGSKCAGAVATDCFAGSAVVSADCSVIGDTCEIANGMPTCHAYCAAQGLATWDCDGTATRLCYGVAQSEYSCEAVGRSCRALPQLPNVAYCASPSDTCGPADPGINACNGGKISLCVNGQAETLDCGTLPGGQRCVGADARGTARCGP